MHLWYIKLSIKFLVFLFNLTPFYIVKKCPSRLVHAFEITQKLDIIVLEAIAFILQVKVTRKKTYNTVVATSVKDISFIINFFHKTMKGMKALEYRIWSRSFNSQDKDFHSLIKIQNLMMPLALEI